MPAPYGVQYMHELGWWSPERGEQHGGDGRKPLTAQNLVGHREVADQEHLGQVLQLDVLEDVGGSVA